MPLDDYAIKQGGWDAWWRTPSKQNTNDPRQAILWAVADPYIFRSIDGGTTWLDVTPDDDPPNDWDDDPAPTATDVSCIQRADNIHTNGEHYFLYTWQNGAGDWRSWLRKTADDGVNWTWKSLSNVIVDDDGYIYPVSMKAFGGSLIGHDNPGPHFTPTANQFTAVGEADGTFLTMEYDEDYTAYDDDDVGVDYRVNIIFDMGEVITGVKKVFIRGFKSGTLTDFFPAVLRSSSAGVYANTYATGSVSGWGAFHGATPYFGGWLGSVCPTTDDWYHILTTINGDNFRYFCLQNVMRIGVWGDGAQWFCDTIRAEGSVTQYEARGIWMDVDSETGDYIWLTVWKGDDTLNLQKRNTSDMGLVAEYSLGACTIAELNAKTYVAYPYCGNFDGGLVYVFGRLAGPQGLPDPSHLIRTPDGGASWASIENGWGGDYCGAFQAGGDTAGNRTFYAIRNISGNPAKLYTGLESLIYRSDVPFSAGVYVDALTILPSDGTVAVGSDATNDIHTASAPDYASWQDITGGFPGSNVRSLAYV